MQRHRLRVRVRPQGRGRRIYDLTVLWRVGETVLHNIDKKTLAGFMYEKHSTRARRTTRLRRSCNQDRPTRFRVPGGVRFAY